MRISDWSSDVCSSDLGSAASSPDALAARLNKIEKLLEQQRNALDALSANPASPVSSAGSADESQIKALAAARRANQELNERLPSVVLRPVEARLARVERAPQRAVARPDRQAGKPSPKPSAQTAEAPHAAAPPTAGHTAAVK